MTILEALDVLIDEESLADFVYEIRERAREDQSWTGITWDHPRVLRFYEAVRVIVEHRNTLRHDQQTGISGVGT